MSEIPIDKDRVIVVDDEKSMRDFLSIMLKKEGYLVETFPDGESALEYFSENNCDLIIADVRMPGMGGVELLKKVKELEPSTVVMVMTAYASVDTAVDAMKSGAYDYFTKPFNVDDIKLHIDRALKWRRLERENELLKKNLKSAVGLGGLIGNSRLMREVYEMIMSIASSKASVLITGESGTGKELVAWAIHDESQRKDASFVPVNCGAIPENLIESELFGHQKGAFTGATSNKAGLVEKASGGTLFLDEIGEMPPSLQVKLLRFLQEKIIRRVGGVNDIAVDIRVIVATNKDLEAEVAAGNFREDLFYRLNVVHIEMPPLRKRKEDIPYLVKHFIEKHSKELDKSVKAVSEEAMELLMDNDYNGNVRELENVIERAVVLEKGDVIMPASLPKNFTEVMSQKDVSGEVVGEVLSDIPSEGLDLDKAVTEYERRIIEKALKKCGGVKKKAAELLGISFRSIRYKLEKYETDDN